MSCSDLRRLTAILVLGSAIFGTGCESEPLKPMDEPLGSQDAHRAEARMRNNVEEMMEESRRKEAPEEPAGANP